MKEIKYTNALTTISRPKTHAERRVRLSETHIKQKRKSNKLHSEGDSEVPGLRVYYQPSGSATFYYGYRPANQKNFVRFKIGNFNVINVKQARDKARKYAAAILDGKDPVLVKRELKLESTLIEFIENDFYPKRLLRNFGYKSSTVKTIKNYFKNWIYQNI
jgi:hypothetical protein